MPSEAHQTIDFSVTTGPLTLSGSVFPSSTPQAPRVLAMHGGGRQATRHGIRYLLSDLARHGVSSASFDFAGHGESSGNVEGSTLTQRAEQANAVVRQVPLQRPVSLIATSMAGHIACRLIAHLDPPALVLFCPAAYAAEAQDVPFGPAFRSVLRATSDYASSPAFTALEHFRGRLLLIYGKLDSVIPAQVLAQYESRARRAKSVEVIRLGNAEHRLHSWLPNHPEEGVAVSRAVLRTLSD